MPLFPDKAYGQLEWADIKSFLGRCVPESEILDYKQEMPKDPIETTIMAMANTYGGDILVGVAEDRSRRGRPVPVDQVRGIPDAARVQAQIESANRHIQPPVLGVYPEVVPIPKGEHPDKAEGCSVIVVRIHLSDLVPHFVPRIGVYGRAGAHNQSYRDEPLETSKIEWLLDRRRRHVDLREALLGFVDAVRPAPVWHKVWCVPLFPSDHIWPDCDAKALADHAPRFGTSPRGPLPFFAHRAHTYAPPRPVQHGWMWEWEDDFEVSVKVLLRAFYFYLVDDRGLLVHKAITKPEICGMQQPPEPQRLGEHRRLSSGIRFDWTTVTLALVGLCEHAANLYEEFGYNGPVQLGLEVGVSADLHDRRPLLGRLDIDPEALALQWWEEWDRLGDDRGLIAPQMLVSDSDQCLARELRERSRITPIHRRWLRAFGYEPSSEEVADRLSKVCGYLALAEVS